jgi:hypothetical protein
MKLHEIIEASEALEYIPFEEIITRKKQLNTYFEGNGIVLVWAVTNTGGRSTICPVNEFHDCVNSILDTEYPELDEEEREEQIELFGCYSKFLKDL